MIGRNINQTFFFFVICLYTVTCIKIHTQTKSTVTYDSLKSAFGASIDYKYYDNLNSANTNYYYGSITKQAYQMSVKLYKLDDYEQCSSLTPFATKDMQSCQICPQDRPLFNLGTRQCQICKPHINQQCDAIFNITTPSLITSNNTTISSTNKSSSTEKVVTLNNQNTTTTNFPKPTETPSPITLSPITPVTGTTTSSSKPSSLISGVSSGSVDSPYVVQWTPNRNKTEENKVTADVSESTNANYNSVFQPVPIRISTVVPHQNYTFIDYRVVDTSNTTKKNGSQKVLIAQSHGDNQTFSDKQCLSDKPFFNINTKNCQSCKTSDQYVPALRKCFPIIYVSNIKYKNIILQEPDQLLKANQKIAKANPQRTVVICPLDQPLSINNTCKGCSSLELFNLTKQQCQLGCPQGLVFSQSNAKCIEATYLTNSDASNLLSPMRDFNLFRDSQKKKVNSSSIIVQCPITRPIMINGKCSNCPSQNPLFNIQSQQCQSCTKNRVYNGQKRKCISQYDTGLQVKKMVPNIF